MGLRVWGSGLRDLGLNRDYWMFALSFSMFLHGVGVRPGFSSLISWKLAVLPEPEIKKKIAAYSGSLVVADPGAVLERTTWVQLEHLLDWVLDVIQLDLEPLQTSNYL